MDAAPAAAISQSVNRRVVANGRTSDGVDRKTLVMQRSRRYRKLSPIQRLLHDVARRLQDYS
jgi:hypothetical protein